MVKNDSGGGSPNAGPHVIEQEVDGDGDRTFLEVVVTNDSVADHVYHEEIEREDSQTESDEPKVVDVQQK